MQYWPEVIPFGMCRPTIHRTSVQMRTMMRLAGFACVGLVTGLVAAGGVHAGVLSPEDMTQARRAFEAMDQSKIKTAKASIDRVSAPLMQKALRWFLYTGFPGAVEWQDISRFIDKNPAWPRLTTLRRNTEERLLPGTPTPQMYAWLETWPPLTARGQAVLIGALFEQGRDDEAIKLVRNTWTERNFSRADEKWFYRKYRKYLTKQDHEQRLDRLLWEGADQPVRRMFGRVNKDLRKLAEARYLLRHMRGNVDSAIARVPTQYKHHAGLVYERLRWRRKKGKNEAAWSLLEDLPSVPPRTDLWVMEREILARRALSDGLVSRAYGLISKHHVGPSAAAPYSTAEWLAGWIALRFLDEPLWALKHFTNMYDVVSYPVSVARAAYWAGRAAQALGDDTGAKIWFERAAVHPTAYYGQLALLHMEPYTGLHMGPHRGPHTEPHTEPHRGLYASASVSPPVESPAAGPADPAFHDDELVRVIGLLDELGEQDRMRPFLVHLKDRHPDDTAWLLATGNLALAVGRHDLAIEVGKRALRTGVFLPGLGYPTIALPSRPQKAIGVAAEQALVYALIRQESAFFVSARSPVGARGLMQMMPTTAKNVAEYVGLPYARARLTTDPVYNLKLGQSYLSRVLNRFDGSYVLGLVAYNAGPHRARVWVKAHGDPRDPEARVADVIDWIELIPIYETRNYVQRVLETVQIYRALASDTGIALDLDNDLLR